MNASEASARSAAAITRWGKKAPAGPVAFVTFWIAGICIRWAVLILASFAAAKTLGFTLWWGLPVGIVSAYIFGAAWNRIHRTSRVLAIEAAADMAERGA